MLTNVTMKSEEDRELYGVTIRQNTKDSFLSLTDLQEAYTHARVLNGWVEKRIDHILAREENAERVYYLLSEQKIINVCFRTFMEEVRVKGIVKVLKGFGVYKTTGRGENKTVYCNPYIWVLLAMELNPQIYAKVVMWLTDRLIMKRIEAGDLCKVLNAQLSKLPNPDYARIAIEINQAILNDHFPGIRNTVGADALTRITRLEECVAFALENGFINTEDEAVALIRKNKNSSITSVN